MSHQLEILTENPSQWSATTYVTPEIQKREIKPFVILALKELEGKPDSRISSLMNADKFAAVRSVVRHVSRARSATRQPWSKDDMVLFLEGLKFSPECVGELTNLLCTDVIYDSMPKQLYVKPGLARLQWKIDLSLWQANRSQEAIEEHTSKDLLHRHTQIIIILHLTNNETHTYRISIAKFHELRFTIASALKNLIVLEKRKCMKKD